MPQDSDGKFWASSPPREGAEASLLLVPLRAAKLLDVLGYARFRHWRLRCYGEEGLAGREAALWLAAESLTLKHEGRPLFRYEARA